MKLLLAFVFLSLCFIGCSAFSGESERAQEKDNDKDDRGLKSIDEDGFSDALRYKVNLLYGTWECKKRNETHIFTKDSYTIKFSSDQKIIYKYQILLDKERGANYLYLLLTDAKGQEKEISVCFGKRNQKPWDEDALYRFDTYNSKLDRVADKNLKKPKNKKDKD